MAEENKRPEELDLPEEEYTEGSGFFEWTRSLVGAVLLVVLLFVFAVQVVRVEGPSMQPTLYAEDMILAVKPAFSTVEVGDVVLVRQYNAPLSDMVVKRVIAMDGQTVDIDFDSGTVYVDGVALEEEYIPERTYMEEGLPLPVTLGEGEIFVMGDNRNHSTDSRSPLLGVVDERYVVGEAFFVLLPGKSAQYLGEWPGTGKRDFGRIGLIK